MLCPYPVCMWGNSGTLCSRSPCPRLDEAKTQLRKKIAALQSENGPAAWMPNGITALQAELDALEE